MIKDKKEQMRKKAQS